MNSPQLTTFLQSLKTDLINSMQARGMNTAGNTAKQFYITTDGDNKAQLEIPGFMQVLEKGRGPTSKNAVKGVPPMIQRIKEWCQVKGIPEKEAWAIKKTIDKKGIKGKPGLLTEPLSEENIDRRLRPIMEALANELIGNLSMVDRP